MDIKYEQPPKSRPSKHYTFLKMALVMAEQSTCARRAVGAILVSSKWHIISSGYNGTAYGLTHCTYRACNGADAESGTRLDDCKAIHAEQNALMQCRDVHDIRYAYVTTAPCTHCTKMLLNTSCRAIYFLNEYPDSDKCKELWESAGRTWEQITL